MPHKTEDDYGLVYRDYQIVCKKCRQKTRLDPLEPYCQHCGQMICPQCLSIDSHCSEQSWGEVTEGSCDCAKCGYEIVDWDR